MAALATMTLGEINEGPKKVFPLFQRPSAKPAIAAPGQGDKTLPKAPNASNKNGSQKKATAGSKSKKDSKKEDTETPIDQENGNARSELLAIDPNDGRRKRRKTVSPTRKAQAEEFEDDGIEIVAAPTKTPQRSITKGNAAKDEGPLETQVGESRAKEEKSMATSAPIAESKDSVPEKSTQTPPVTIGLTISPNISLKSANGAPDPNTGAGGTTEVKLATKPIMPGNANEVGSKPKKTLRLNPKTGTIGSPPPKKAIPVKNIGRKSTSKSKIVTIRYGNGQKLPTEIGQKIEEILDSLKTAPPVSENPPEKQQKVVTKADTKAEKTPSTAPPKPVHPLFTGKAGKPSTTNVPPTKNAPPQPTISPKKATVTRGRVTSQSYERPPPPAKPASRFSGFGNPTGMLKFPGAVEPAWPWKGTSHVRGSTGNSVSASEETPLSLGAKAKKAKYQAVEVLGTEDIIARLAHSLNVEHIARGIREINPDEFPTLPNCLRIPNKHYEGGSALQQRAGKGLKTKSPLTKSTPGSSEDKVPQLVDLTQNPVHPAVSRVYNSIPTSLSAFDQNICESQSWVQKHAPKCASEVLQHGREAMILKGWLENLTVKAVETGMSETSSKSGAATNPDCNGKRKRKTKKLDSFVVSSDEEYDLDEITEPEDDISGFGGSSNTQKTVVRPAKDGKKFLNSVVLSGPHGCGKTAAVYAVAKELEFEVFEINSSSRRSGKDILEKVGDMTRNHLVQQSHNPTLVDEENLRIDEALAKDIQSGRQGTMNSFFKTKEPMVPIPRKPKPAADTKKVAGVKKAEPPTKYSTQQKKQSLILIEEADIIYDEDKLFWSTILTLVAQSKRPVIITCNNEAVLPMEALMLHAIIRFTPTPVDLAVDYILLVAACEGHVLKRDAVSLLYETRGCDLRGSLMELNFWCQFAIGDVKGGLEWSYPRWPVGRDVDKNGEKIRVVSEGTYQTGMGWFSQDMLESHSHYLDIEEEMLHEAWDGWNLDAGDWQKSIKVDSWATTIKSISTCRKDNIAALGMYADFSEAMSAADICSGGAFGEDNQVLIDIDQPILSTKAREDYTLAHPILEASPKVDFGSMTKTISLYIKSRARKILQEDQHINHSFEIPVELSSPSESDLISLVTKQVSNPEPRIRRLDFALAFDPISEPDKPYVWSSNTLEASSFDRTITMIAVDLAPWVRGIVACDARLMKERKKLSNMLSEGGRAGKRMRTTRAAMSALEGGARGSTRKERYFGNKLNKIFVLNTGCEAWLEAAIEEEKVAMEALAVADGDENSGGGSEDEGTIVDNVPGVSKKAGRKGEARRMEIPCSSEVLCSSERNELSDSA